MCSSSALRQAVLSPGNLAMEETAVQEGAWLDPAGSAGLQDTKMNLRRMHTRPHSDQRHTHTAYKSTCTQANLARARHRALTPWDAWQTTTHFHALAHMQTHEQVCTGQGTQLLMRAQQWPVVTAQQQGTCLQVPDGLVAVGHSRGGLLAFSSCRACTGAWLLQQLPTTTIVRLSVRASKQHQCMLPAGTCAHSHHAAGSSASGRHGIAM